MDRILGRNHHECRGYAGAGKQIEKNRRQDHRALIDKARREQCSWRSRVPSGRRLQAAAPCRKKAPRAFPSRIQVRPFHNGINRTGFLAKSAIDAFDHIDVVSGRAPRAVITTRTGFDGDGLCRTDRLTELARDAALLPVGIASQRVLATKAWRDRPLLEGVVERGFALEEIPHCKQECRYEFKQKHGTGSLIEPHDVILCVLPR